MVTVNEEKCLGCGICVFFCPADALQGLGTIEVNMEKCLECLDCIEACPVDALEVKE